MDYPTNNHPPPMHHQIPSHFNASSSQHPLLSNQLQPINPDTHTSMWLDDPYAVSNASASQRDSGFNSRPASLRSIDSTVTSTTGPLHHGPPMPLVMNKFLLHLYQMIMKIFIHNIQKCNQHQFHTTTRSIIKLYLNYLIY